MYPEASHFGDHKKTKQTVSLKSFCDASIKHGGLTPPNRIARLKKALVLQKYEYMVESETTKILSPMRKTLTK